MRILKERKAKEGGEVIGRGNHLEEGVEGAEIVVLAVDGGSAGGLAHCRAHERDGKEGEEEEWSCHATSLHLPLHAHLWYTHALLFCSRTTAPEGEYMKA